MSKCIDSSKQKLNSVVVDKLKLQYFEGEKKWL